MNIIEALNKCFLQGNTIFRKSEKEIEYFWNEPYNCVMFSLPYILAEDWEVKEEKPKLTGGLLPCPMCGYNMPDMIEHSGTYHVLCKCGLATSLSKQDSVAAHDWNRRVESTIHTDNTEVIQKAEAWIAQLEKQCEMYSKNVNGLQKHLEEAREERDKYKTAMDELWKSHDEEMRKAFKAGRRTLLEMLDKRNASFSAKSFDEWKKDGAK